MTNTATITLKRIPYIQIRRGCSVFNMKISITVTCDVCESILRICGIGTSSVYFRHGFLIPWMLHSVSFYYVPSIHHDRYRHGDQSVMVLMMAVSSCLMELVNYGSERFCSRVTGCTNDRDIPWFTMACVINSLTLEVVSNDNFVNSLCFCWRIYCKMAIVENIHHIISSWNYLSIPKLQWLHHWSLGMDK